MSLLAERLDALDQKFDRLIDLMSTNNELMQGKLEEVTKPWLNDEDMRQLFGWKASKSQHYKRKLSWMRKKGILTKFSSCRPYMYERLEAETVARKVATGVIDLPKI